MTHPTLIQNVIHSTPHSGSFIFDSPVFAPETGQAVFSYRCGSYHFQERLEFGVPAEPLPQPRLEAIHRALNFAAMAAGISYFKAFMSPHIETEDMDESTSHFFEKFYRKGLGEFITRNKLQFSDDNYFKPTQVSSALSSSVTLTPQALVLIGGGKDSLVTLEALRQQNHIFTLFAVNPAPPILDCIKVSGMPARLVKRHIDPQLFTLNDQGAPNGHVPVTGIISFLAIVTALIHDFDTIILSNERSADEPTFADINHQYSKSFEFEADMQNFIWRAISPSISYFSFLRPLSELHITRLFAQEQKYDSVFTSCNKAYSLRQPLRDKKWCGECPKCQFVFLSLATTLTPARVIPIFGSSLLDDSKNLSAYRHLTGLAGHKPWECVGEILESASALYALSLNPDWAQTQVVKTLAPELLAQYGEERLQTAYQDSLKPAARHAIAERYRKAFDDYVQ
jgi:7-cyano-7-deazaguanine synthase in queuosine biosynthesis